MRATTQPAGQRHPHPSDPYPPTRAFLSMMAFEMVEPAPMPTGTPPLASTATFWSSLS